MRIQFLGTAAFEGIPALFCKCELCQKSMLVKGKNIRTRTSVMIDDELKIDFPADSYYHMLQNELDFEKVKDILFTHSHSDHLYAEDLAARLPGYSQSLDHCINIYGNDRVVEKCNEIFQSEGGVRNKFRTNVVYPFERKKLETSVIVPLLAKHDPNETCLLYYIEKSGKSILYGHDSGWFPAETLDWLEGKRLDIVILECTMGHIDYRETHMNIDAVLEMKSILQQFDVIDSNSKMIVTHFSHNAQLMHEDLCDIFSPHDIITAYDGMILNI